MAKKSRVITDVYASRHTDRVEIEAYSAEEGNDFQLARDSISTALVLSRKNAKKFAKLILKEVKAAERDEADRQTVDSLYR